MRKLLFVATLFALSLTAANYKLYLKDGDFQLVREYQVDGDRVRYYSVERSDWQEMPVSLIDLKRTEAEAGERKTVLDKQAKDADDEEVAAREIRAETRKIPQDPGVYRLENNELRIFNLVDAVVHNEKGLNALKKLAPIPVFAGKATLEIPAEHSSNVIKESRPEFYIQLSEFQVFGIVKLTPQKGVRVVEKLSFVAFSKELQEERTSVEIFQKQLSDNGLYKIWPQESLAAGEYAVIEYTEGKLNHRVYDFRIE